MNFKSFYTDSETHQDNGYKLRAHGFKKINK